MLEAAIAAFPDLLAWACQMPAEGHPTTERTLEHPDPGRLKASCWPVRGQCRCFRPASHPCDRPHLARRLAGVSLEQAPPHALMTWRVPRRGPVRCSGGPGAPSTSPSRLLSTCLDPPRRGPPGSSRPRFTPLSEAPAACRDLVATPSARPPPRVARGNDSLSEAMSPGRDLPPTPRGRGARRSRATNSPSGTHLAPVWLPRPPLHPATAPGREGSQRSAGCPWSRSDRR